MDEYLPDIPLEEPAHPDLHPDGPLPFDLPAQNQEQAPGELPEIDFPQISIPDTNQEFTVHNDPHLCLDFTPVELEVMLRSETETVQQFYDQVAQSQVEYDNANHQTFTEDAVTPSVVSPKPNTLIELTLPIFAGDTAVYEQKRLLNLEIKHISDEFKHTHSHQFLNHKNKTRCSICNHDALNLIMHLAMGPFAPQHPFSTLDKNIQIEVLLHSTLKYKDKILVGAYDAAVKIDIYNQALVSPSTIQRLTASAKTVPAVLSFAINSFSPIYVCGGHSSIFPSLLSLALHHITCKHIQHTHVCRMCGLIQNTSFLQHYQTVHNRHLLPYYPLPNIPVLHDIYDFQTENCKVHTAKQIELYKLNTAQQASLIHSRKGMKLNNTVQDLFSSFPSKVTATYIRLKELYMNFPEYSRCLCSSDSFPLNIISLLKAVSHSAVIAAALEEVNRLTENRPPWEGISTFLKTGKLELLQLLYLALIRPLFHKAVKVPDLNKWKTGSSSVQLLQLTSPSIFADNPYRLKEMDLTVYTAITCGSKLLLKSGITTMERYKFLNLSPTKKPFLCTSGFTNIGFYPSLTHSLPVLPDNAFINQVSKIAETTKVLPIIVEFNIQENLSTIPANKWKSYLTEHQESYCLGFCLQILHVKTKTRPLAAENRTFVLIGQSTLYHQDLDLRSLVDLTDNINMQLQTAALTFRLPLILPSALVGFSSEISLPLIRCPSQATFKPDGQMSDYSHHQGLRLLFTIVDGLKMIEDMQLMPSFRTHMVKDPIIKLTAKIK